MARRLKIVANSLALTATVGIVLLLLPATGDAHYANAHRHTGIVKHTVLEQFDVTATELRMQVYYSQNNSKVYNARHKSGACYHSAFPGWVILSCTYQIHNLDNHAGEWIRGWFRHPATGTQYRQRAHWHALPQNSYAYYCRVYDGSLPPGWDSKCSGRRE
jgi:hypothetical protein